MLLSNFLKVIKLEILNVIEQASGLPVRALSSDKKEEQIIYNLIPVSDDGTNSATVYEYQGGNAFVVGSTEITIETEDVISAKQDENMINFPYGTTFTGYIYIKVSSAT